MTAEKEAFVPQCKAACSEEVLLVNSRGRKSELGLSEGTTLH